MIWPSFERWRTLDHSLRVHLAIVLVLFLAVSTVGVSRPGPSRTERMVLEWAQAHVELGLSQTKGYNLSTRWLTTTTPVHMGSHEVYLSAPPLYTLLFAGVYALGGRNWRALRVAPMLLGLIYLYGCLVLACTFLKGPARGWLLYLACSPMILINASDLEINAGTLGLAVLSYLCFCNYLASAARRWLMWAGLFYLLAFWSSYVAFAILPPMVLQLLLHRGLSWREKRTGLLTWLVIIGFGFAVMLAHVASLPGALEAMAGRARLRYSTSLGDAAQTGIDPFTFFIRQAVRSATYFTPISVVLAGMALAVGIRRLFQPRVPDTAEAQRHVSPWAALLQFGAWGLPFGVLAVNLAYIHPVTLYYFAIFFAFGSALALQWIDERGSGPKRRLGLHGLVGAFLIISLTRSLFTMGGGSLPLVLSDYLPEFITRAFAPGH